MPFFVKFLNFTFIVDTLQMTPFPTPFAHPHQTPAPLLSGCLLTVVYVYGLYIYIPPPSG